MCSLWTLSTFNDLWMHIRKTRLDRPKKQSNADPSLLTVYCAESVLGLVWDPQEDVIIFRLNKWTDRKVTKRSVLSFIASQFDPLGLISSTTLSWKRFCQELWKNKTKWDDELTPTDVKEWKKLMKDVKDQTFNWKRQALSDGHWNLRVFTDASKEGYAAVIYGRSSEPTGKVQTKILFAKSRFMPLKPLTIFKAELVAPQIGARALRHVQKELQLEEAKITAWSDSKCVLYWLRKTRPEALPRFIQNRVKNIHELGIRFRFVPACDDPADVGSRECPPEELQENPCWWNGPELLSHDEAEWPEDIEVTQEDVTEELQLIQTQPATTFLVNNNQTEEVTDITSYNNLQKLESVISKIILLSNEANKRPDVQHSVLKQKTLKPVIKLAQWTITPAEIQRWQLRKDEEGIYRTHARLDNIPHRISQVYLPSNHHITHSIILQYHVQSILGGVSLVPSKLRQEYCLPKGRQTVKKIIKRDCHGCRRWSAKPFRPPPLPTPPAERVTPSRSFQHIGVDYLEPVLVKIIQFRRGGYVQSHV